MLLATMAREDYAVSYMIFFGGEDREEGPPHPYLYERGTQVLDTECPWNQEPLQLEEWSGE